MKSGICRYNASPGMVFLLFEPAPSLNTSSQIMSDGRKVRDSIHTAGRKRKRRSPRSADEIRGLLLRAARREFTQFGYKGTTTAAIARKADVTEALLFKYFGSKANLCREAVQEPLKQSYANFTDRFLSDIAGVEDRKDRVAIFIKSMQNWIYEQSELLTVLAVLEAYGKENTGLEGGLDWLNPYFDIGADLMASRLDPEPKLDPALMTRISFAGVLACVMFNSWLFSGSAASGDEIVAAIGDFLVGGIQANS